ncbi:NAD-dependent epimerase/dehydratase family protein [Alkalihalobacillus sp. CinArs1]|uniref:NAD-dependent epimerase/dehydratase family protein n=1 Tax=Alkalihalobacillus sp. CinArs1 TaxID=2995314 RepID=UPI0022DE5C7F|nr:NAD-dependent epimerase/dehydratase family protein [Alkalihalobacillus sp. CinArs1]
MSDDSILITGASGFTGQHACRHFLKTDLKVTAVVRNTCLEGLRSVQCDLTDKNAIDRLIKEEQPTYVLHLAGVNAVQTSWENPVSTLEANVLSTVYLLDAIRTTKPSTKVVMVGSALQYDPAKGKPSHPYALSKTMQSQVALHLAELYNLHVVLAKPTNLIGPGNSSGICALLTKHIVDMERNLTSEAFSVSNLQVKRDFLDVRDVVSAYEKLFVTGERTRTYDLATGRLVALQEVVRELETLTEVSHFVVDKKLGENGTVIPMDVSNIKNLGWNPTYSLRQSLEDSLEYYRNLEQA